MDPKRLIGQIIGIAVTLLCIIAPQFKKKWQIAAIAILSNLMAGLNFLLLGQISACGITVVGMIQGGFAIRHTKKGSATSLPEILIFGALYVLGGLLPFLASGTLSEFGFIDTLPILGAMFYLLHLVQKDEQRMRVFSFCNCVTFFVYDAIILSTQIFAQLFGMLSALLAIYRYRKRGDGSARPKQNNL